MPVDYVSLAPMVRLVANAAEDYWYYTPWDYAEEESPLHPLGNPDIRMQVAVAVLRDAFGDGFITWVTGHPSYDCDEYPQDGDDAVAYEDGQSSYTSTKSAPREDSWERMYRRFNRHFDQWVKRPRQSKPKGKRMADKRPRYELDIFAC